MTPFEQGCQAVLFERRLLTLTQAAFLVFFFLSAVLDAGGGVGSFLAFLLLLSFSTAAVGLGVSLTGVAAGLSLVLRLFPDFGGEGSLTGSGDDSVSLSSSTTSGSSSTSSSSSSSTGTVAIVVSVWAIFSASSSLGTGLPAL